MIPNANNIIARFKVFQAQVREVVRRSHTQSTVNAAVSHTSSADTIYQIDTEVEPLLIAFCEDFARETPLVLVAEGLRDESGNEVLERVFPAGLPPERAPLRLIVDPIDGTRGIMYDKRPAWTLAGLAPNKGPATRLRDIEIAVMSELPTSKMGAADLLWATKGGGAHGERINLHTGQSSPLKIAPSRADTINHGFATVSNFFPGTKILAAELMEQIALAVVGKIDVTRATVFDDQYISTGGQFYELLAGHDRFIADLRPAFYALQNQPEGLCCHPYDCATMLIAEEAGILLTDAHGNPLDGPLDTTTGISWIAYANETLRQKIAPVIAQFFALKSAKRA